MTRNNLVFLVQNQIQSGCVDVPRRLDWSKYDLSVVETSCLP